MSCNVGERERTGEQGSALILALMVALVLTLLGMGLLLQTSLGQQAAGADRWVSKSMHAADAGVMMQIEMLQIGQYGSVFTHRFVLEDDRGGGFANALLGGRYEVTVNYCEAETNYSVPGSQCSAEQSETPCFGARHFHVRSTANRRVGNLVGTTRSTAESDVTLWPMQLQPGFVTVRMCN